MKKVMGDMKTSPRPKARPTKTPDKGMKSSPIPKENPFLRGKDYAKMQLLKRLKDAQGKVDDQGMRIKKPKKK
jgi:hypothetical protein